MSIKRIPKNSVVEEFIAQLRRAIEEGVYPPGTHLNQEELAAAAGLSRTPVRLALLAMAREGLLAESTQGYRVIRLDVEEALDIFEIQAALEGVIARIAAKRATPAAVKRLMKAAESGPVFTAAANDPRDFHTIIAESVGWPVVRRLQIIAHSGTTLGRSELLSALSRNAGTPAGDEKAAREEHRKIANAIAENNGALAERLARDHFMEGRDRLEKAFRKNR
jgi:GntR family transcriptional regulator, vanillate catabolism transcriptional regulator